MLLKYFVVFISEFDVFLILGFCAGDKETLQRYTLERKKSASRGRTSLR